MFVLLPVGSRHISRQSFRKKSLGGLPVQEISAKIYEAKLLKVVPINKNQSCFKLLSDSVVVRL